MEARIKDKIKEIEEFLFELNEIAPNNGMSHKTPPKDLNT